MIKTKLLNGITTERDTDYTALGLTVLEAGVVSGLEVTNNQVATGTAFIKVTRTATTPTEEILVKLEITANEVIDTSGTKKVWLEINQNNINDPGLNDVNGTTAGSIKTGASYPAGNYIPLASITSGVITDERVFVRLKLLRKGLTEDTILWIDENGEEKYLPFDRVADNGKSIVVSETEGLILQSSGVDVVWLDQKNTPTGNDLFLLSDSEDSAINKNIKFSDLVKSNIWVVTAGESGNKGDAIGYVIEDYVYKNASNFNNANTTNITGCKIEENKFLIAYTDVWNWSQGTAIIATITDNVVSYGSEYVFQANSTDGISLALVDTNKVAISYRNVWGSNVMRAIIATISGTTITYGTAQTFDGNNCLWVTKICKLDTNKVVINYAGASARGWIICGTISGTVFTFGTTVQYIADNSVWVLSIVTLTTWSVLFNYGYGADSGSWYARIATIAGTAITLWASAYKWNNWSTSDVSTYAITAWSVIFSYVDGGNSSKGTSIVASISGTVVTFWSEYVYSTWAITQTNIVTFWSSFFLFYRDVVNSNYITAVTTSISGTVVTFSNYYVDSNNSVFLLALDNNTTSWLVAYSLTSDTKGYAKTYIKESWYFKTKADNINRVNFIWFARKNYTLDGNIEVDFSGITETLTGLTKWLNYYLSNTSGAISTTPGSTIVPVGMAIDTTKIKIKSDIWVQSQAVITPTVWASPFTYQNNTGKQIVLSITGGTVSAVAFSRNNTDFYQTSWATNTFVVLGVNDYCRITYTVAPVLKTFTI